MVKNTRSLRARTAIKSTYELGLESACFFVLPVDLLGDSLDFGVTVRDPSLVPLRDGRKLWGQGAIHPDICLRLESAFLSCLVQFFFHALAVDIFLLPVEVVVVERIEAGHRLQVARLRHRLAHQGLLVAEIGA